jgi:hypothetical protein
MNGAGQTWRSMASCTAARFSPSWNVPMLDAPSPKKLTRSSSGRRNDMALPAAIGILAPTMALETIAPAAKSARWHLVAFSADATGHLAPDLGCDRLQRGALAIKCPAGR